MDSLISTFHIDWRLMVAQAVNFAVVLIVLYVFALRPLKKLMDERGKTIAGGLENAKKQEELLAESKAAYEKALADARAEAAALKKEAKTELAAYRTEEMEKIHAESAAAKDANKKAMEADRVKIMDDIRKEAVTLVIAASEKILGEAAKGKIDTKLVEESIKNI